MRLRAFLLVTALLIILAGCGDDGPQVLRGPVVGREYDDPDTWNDYCLASVKTGEYSSVCVLWHEASDEAHWKLQLSCRIGDVDHRNWVEVPQQTYDAFDFNDSYPEDGDCLIEADDDG